MNKLPPKDFIQLVIELDNIIHFESILIVNTQTTAPFLDNFLLGENRVTRIKYTLEKYDDFTNMITNMIKKYSLICLDPHHEYKESIDSFNNLLPLLEENGVLICHDCNPPNFSYAHHKYKPGGWCGVTYAAFVETMYNNPMLYYAVINNDYGLGIISKNKIEYTERMDMGSGKQLNFLNLFRASDYENAYNYFKDNICNIVNLIT